MARSNSTKKHYEYIIVGTGPGGATVARELAKTKKAVVMIEKGRRHEKVLGVPFGPTILEGYGIFCRSVEGSYVARAITVGGSSVVYNGNAFDPPNRVYKQMGVDFSQEIKEIRDELDITKLPDRFFQNCTGLFRMIEVASSMGHKFIPQSKFIDPNKCVVGCDSCMLGCRKGAKWTAREFVDEAVGHGADLMDSTNVHSVIVDKGKARGIRTQDGTLIFGEKIIVAAGGVGSPAILLRSGLQNAGQKFFFDPMDVVVGFTKEKGRGAWRQTSFTHAFLVEDDGHFLIGNVATTAMLFMGLMRANILLNNLSHLPYIKRGMGLFVKLADKPHGRVYANGRISKPMLEEDRRRLRKATDLCREILIQSGVDPKSIVIGESIGGHPGGTAAMGSVVDRSFQTDVLNLYVCDASVLPESPGSPPALTILGMSKLFSKTLLGTVDIQDRTV